MFDMHEPALDSTDSLADMESFAPQQSPCCLQSLTRHNGKTAASEVVSRDLARGLKLRHSFGRSDSHAREGTPPPPPADQAPSKPDESALSPAVTVSADRPDSALPSICQRSRKLDGIVEQLRLAGLAYIPVSHLHWGLWGLVLARSSNVPGFDYEAYAVQRLHEFRQLFGELLGERKQ